MADDDMNETIYLHDAQWDEDRGGDRHPHNLISFPTDGDFYKATKNILWWSACERDADATTRALVPSTCIEAIFARAPVYNPNDLTDHSFLTKCLHMSKYMAPALETLIDDGLLHEDDEDGNKRLIKFKNLDTFYTRCAILLRVDHNPTYVVTADSWEWLEGWDPEDPEATKFSYFAGITLDSLTHLTNDLTLYTDLALTVGARATQAVRVNPGSTFSVVVGGEEGGQLVQAIKAFYFSSNQAQNKMDPSFLCQRLASYLLESQWPDPYKQAYPRWIDYAFDLARRGTWKTATRQEWATLVYNKLAPAIEQHLPTLHKVFLEILDDPGTLSREYQSLGDLVLAGDEGTKYPFWKILDVEAILLKDYAGTILSEREAGGDTTSILAKLSERLRASRRVSKGSEPTRDASGGDDMRGPKPGQMERALADASYTRLEAIYTHVLQAGDCTTAMKLLAIRDAFDADTVLPKAVLFATTGMRLAVYVGAGGSDYLSLLHGCRHLLETYLGQGLAYDADEKAVPDELRFFRLDEKQTRLLCDFRWTELDPLNYIILKIRGERAGTSFKKYSTKNLYHHGDMLTHLQDLVGKLYETIGFSREVAPEEGVTYRGFIAKLKRLQTYAVALSAVEQPRAYQMIDDFALGAIKAAQEDAKRTLYGPSPADRKLHAWLKAEEPILIELEEFLAKMQEMAVWRRRTGSVFGPKTEAAQLEGFAAIAGTSHQSPGPRAPKAPKPKAPKTASGGGPARTAIKKTAGGTAAPKSSGAGKSPKRIFVYDDGTFTTGAFCNPLPPRLSMVAPASRSPGILDPGPDPGCSTKRWHHTDTAPLSRRGTERPRGGAQTGLTSPLPRVEGRPLRLRPSRGADCPLHRARCTHPKGHATHDGLA